MRKTADERRFFFPEWAKRKDKRQRDIIRETGLTKGYISLLWSGQKEPSQDALARLAKAIGVPPGMLLVNPESASARAVAAMEQIPKDKQETAVEMLEGLAGKKPA